MIDILKWLTIYSQEITLLLVKVIPLGKEVQALPQQLLEELIKAEHQDQKEEPETPLWLGAGKQQSTYHIT